jgi:hypothetical protein
MLPETGKPIFIDSPQVYEQPEIGSLSGALDAPAKPIAKVLFSQSVGADFKERGAE